MKKKLMALTIGLSLAIGAVSVSLAQDKQTGDKKTHKGKKKKKSSNTQKKM